MKKVIIIGGGLAGCEAAWQVALQKIPVILYEMRPLDSTPAHKTNLLAELVCSNSLGSNDKFTAPGTLKEELRILNSLLIKCADTANIGTGSSLIVDRSLFSKLIEEKLTSNPLIEIKRQKINWLPLDKNVILATGPLTTESLAKNLQDLLGEKYLYFYDAVSPIVACESLNFDKIFEGSRYNKSGLDYLNCPMNKLEYENFWHNLVEAEKVSLKPFEKNMLFESCLPIEEIAQRGINTLLFGPLKPVGLINPLTKKQPYAVVQLRPENKDKTLYNLVGFQTRLLFKEQKRVFQMIPGLEKAEFVRFGVMHRNSFINSPICLKVTNQLKKYPNILLAGQITGTEGYTESIASGLVAGLNAGLLIKGRVPLIFPKTTAIGSLMNYITESDASRFQPTNINFGIMPPLEKRVKSKKLKHQEIAKRSQKDLANFLANNWGQVCTCYILSTP